MNTRKALHSINHIHIDQRYRLIKPRPQRPNFAAIIDDLDLSRGLSEELQIELKQALSDFEVIFLPAQAMSPEMHLSLAKVFGAPINGAFFPRMANHPLIEIIEFNEQRKPEANIWHSDLSWTQNPPAGTVIQIVENPPQGGETSWASMSRAYSELSPDFQKYIENLTACHTWEIGGWRDIFAKQDDGLLSKMILKYPPVNHPLVKMNPVSDRKVLFINENFTKNINDIHFREGKAILDFLTGWIIQPEFIYTHKWEKNGIAIWDNLGTQHYAGANYYPHRRVTNRVTFSY